MTHKTHSETTFNDEELGALVKQLLSFNGDGYTRFAGKTMTERAADAITTLRTQLAEVKTEKEKLGREVNLARYGQPDFSWQVHKEALAEANARAEQAEAALDAQIEADARIADRVSDTHGKYAETNSGPQRTRDISMQLAAHKVAYAIRSQPHDRTALDRMLAAAREQALRDAADEMEDERAKQAILALIEKP